MLSLRIFVLAGMSLVIVFLTSGAILVADENGNITPGFCSHDYLSYALPIGLTNLTKMPPIPIPPALSHTVSIRTKTDRSVPPNSGGVATDLKTLGDVVLVPITPTPAGMGYSYFYPNGTDPGYLIYSPGNYTLGSGFSTTNNSAIRISASDVILEGNGQTITGFFNGTGVEIESGASDVTINDFTGITGFREGINSTGERSIINNNTINDNGWGFILRSDHASLVSNTANNNSWGIILRGDYASLGGNTANNNSWGIILEGNNSNIADNIAFHNTWGLLFQGNNFNITSNTVYHNTWGLSFEGNNASIEGNHAISNGYGIISFGDNATMGSNNAFFNWYGIISSGENATLGGNEATNNDEGINIYGNNSVFSGNNVSENRIGITLSDSSIGTSIIGNTLVDNPDNGLRINFLNGGGNGTIYDNYFGNVNNTGGDGNATQFIWTNPAGPQLGINVVGGPYIAGNYWSNPTETGWSDLQPGDPNGYTRTPYEVAPGANDTAPLVKTLTPTPSPTVTPTLTPTVSPTPTPGLSYLINATSNDLGTIKPSGLVSVPAGGNLTFHLQARPGAEITILTVDGSPASIQPGNTYTFTDVVADHSIRLTCSAKKGVIIAGFNANITSNPSPFTVQFTDTSYGSPTMWFWMLGDGNWSTLQNPVHTYTKAGTKTVRLWVRNLYAGGIITKKGYIEVNPSGPSINLVPIPSFTSEGSDASVMMNEIPQDIKNLMMSDNITPLDSSNSSESPF